MILWRHYWAINNKNRDDGGGRGEESVKKQNLRDVIYERPQWITEVQQEKSQSPFPNSNFLLGRNFSYQVSKNTCVKIFCSVSSIFVKRIFFPCLKTRNSSYCNSLKCVSVCHYHICKLSEKCLSEMKYLVYTKQSQAESWWFLITKIYISCYTD